MLSDKFNNNNLSASKDLMIINVHLLVLDNRLLLVEKKLRMMKIKKLTKKLYGQQPPLPSIERVIYEEAQELARQRKWSVSFTLSFMWSQFKGAGDIKKAEAAFVLMQREEEGKGKRDPIFAEW